ADDLLDLDLLGAVHQRLNDRHDERLHWPLHLCALSISRSTTPPRRRLRPMQPRDTHPCPKHGTVRPPAVGLQPPGAHGSERLPPSLKDRRSARLAQRWAKHQGVAPRGGTSPRATHGKGLPGGSTYSIEGWKKSSTVPRFCEKSLVPRFPALF